MFMALSSSNDIEMGDPEIYANGDEKRPKIVIIGAGIAGIAAGNLLCSTGFDDFTILEATDRIGGRILSIDLGKGLRQRLKLLL